MAGEGAKRSATIELTDAQKEKYAVKVRFTRGSGSSSDAAANGITLTSNKSEVKATGSKVSLELAVPAAAAEGFYEGAVDFTAGDDVISVPFGLKIGDAGIDVDMVKSVLTNRQGQDMSVVGEATNGQASFAINLAGQLDHMDIVFADEDGNDLGVVGTLDTTTLLEDRWYGYVSVLGQYYPFTGDAGDPIASKPVWAAQGAYTLRLIGNDVDGNTVQATRPIYVDTTSPTYEDGLSAYSMAHPKVVEIPADAKEHVMKASLVDGELEAIRAHGIDISQAENRLYFTRFTSNPEGLWYPDANGDVNGTVTLSPGPSTNVRMWAADAAGNIATRQEVMLVRQGYPYVIGDADAAAARPGDVVSYTFTAHDTQAWADYAMDLRYSPTFTEVLSVEKTDELGALASGEITTSERTVSGQVIRRVGVTFDDQVAGVTRDELATFKVTFKVLQPPVAQQVGLYISGVYAKSLAGGKQAQVAYPGTTLPRSDLHADRPGRGTGSADRVERVRPGARLLAGGYAGRVDAAGRCPAGARGGRAQHGDRHGPRVLGGVRAREGHDAGSHGLVQGRRPRDARRLRPRRPGGRLPAGDARRRRERRRRHRRQGRHRDLRGARHRRPRGRHRPQWDGGCRRSAVGGDQLVRPQRHRRLDAGCRWRSTRARR